MEIISFGIDLMSAVNTVYSEGAVDLVCSPIARHIDMFVVDGAKVGIRMSYIFPSFCMHISHRYSLRSGGRVPTNDPCSRSMYSMNKKNFCRDLRGFDQHKNHGSTYDMFSTQHDMF